MHFVAQLNHRFPCCRNIKIVKSQLPHLQIHQDSRILTTKKQQDIINLQLQADKNDIDDEKTHKQKHYCLRSSSNSIPSRHIIPTHIKQINLGVTKSSKPSYPKSMIQQYKRKLHHHETQPTNLQRRYKEAQT